MAFCKCHVPLSKAYSVVPDLPLVLIMPKQIIDKLTLLSARPFGS